MLQTRILLAEKDLAGGSMANYKSVKKDIRIGDKESFQKGDFIVFIERFYWVDL